MKLIYVDEKSQGSSYGLGVLVVHDEQWRHDLIRSLKPFRPPLMYHATEDRQIHEARFQDLRAEITRIVTMAIQSPDIVEWNYFAKTTEKESWKAFMSWAYRRYHPNRDERIQVYRDRGNLRRETDLMLSGHEGFLIQAKPKVLPAEARVDSHKIMIGVVDYILYFGIFSGLGGGK